MTDDFGSALWALASHRWGLSPPTITPSSRRKGKWKSHAYAKIPDT